MNKTKFLTLKYAILMGAYWGSVCCAMGFSSTFLLARGFSSTLIGISMAIGNILAVVLAPKVSAIADQSEKIKIHHLVIICGILSLLAFFALFIVKSSVVAIFSVFFLSVALIQILQPLTNSVSIYYVNRNVHINFGLPRAMGSMTYGIISAILGNLVVKFGVDVIPLGGVIITLVLIIAMLLFPKNVGEESNTNVVTTKTTAMEFMKKYPSFPLLLVGIALLFIFQTISNNYVMQLALAIGGDATTAGYALACQAFIELPPMIFCVYFLKKFGSKKLLIFSAIFFVVKAFGFVLVRNQYALYAVMFIQMLSYAIYIPASVDFVNESVGEEDQFQGQAMVTSASTFGAMAGALLGGILVDKAGVFATQKVDFVVALIGMLILTYTLLKSKVMGD